jgi:hypothetical protein
MVWRKTEALRRKAAFNIMEEAILDIKKKYAQHLVIQVRYYFRKYMKNKAIRDAAQRKKDMDKAARQLGGKKG